MPAVQPAMLTDHHLALEGVQDEVEAVLELPWRARADLVSLPVAAGR